MMTITRRIAALATFATLAFTACEAPGEPVDPRAAVVGTYLADESFGAIELTTVANGVTVDWVAAGAQVELELRRDGTTAGHVVVPEADDGQEDFEADLTGTWTISGNTIQLSHSADTFLRDMPLTVRAGALEGDETFGDVRVRLVLARR
jgi:hypothetical protein